ncbi:MAG: tyrosine--tRNA ligase [Candidatus Eisenbacteria bacterium]|uniref:Tyrosine--tRNA ligase n=1 Tax=Eiseniibacteriota bacterium TaxID=2212470 RepID=A0A849SNY3_UNCEI|nr:tyrosine--tRNA ligase [Candidatus Eisenbacteria bacterium]
MLAPEQQFEILARGTEEILPEGALLERLRKCAAAGRPLRVKQGFDPTAPDIHLGHTVGLRKLRQFQELGHQVVLIVGDYTGLVGDPSGRSKTRPQLEAQELEANARTYLDQFYRVLDPRPQPPCLPVEVHRNGEWFAPMSFAEVIRLAAQYTVSRLLERDDFAKRLQANQPISVHELLYPLMQGHDSVAILADVELGATEQKFNLVVGRELQRLAGQEPQVVLTLPVLPGLDGVQRMSKSLGNYIGVTDAPTEMFGKVMSLPDSVLRLFWALVTDAPPDELAAVERELADAAINPMTIKKRLGERIVTMYHDADAALQARAGFDAQFSRREVPENLDEFSRETLLNFAAKPAAPIIIDALMAAGFSDSRSAARRLVEQKAVRIDGEVVTSWDQAVDPGKEFVLRAGRKMKRFAGK